MANVFLHVPPFLFKHRQLASHPFCSSSEKTSLCSETIQSITVYSNTHGSTIIPIHHLKKKTVRHRGVLSQYILQQLTYPHLLHFLLFYVCLDLAKTVRFVSESSIGQYGNARYVCHVHRTCVCDDWCLHICITVIIMGWQCTTQVLMGYTVGVKYDYYYLWSKVRHLLWLESLVFLTFSTQLYDGICVNLLLF